MSARGANDTRAAVAQSIEAEHLGADGLLVVTPYYNKSSASGLTEHYTTVADSVHLPIIVYNVPGRTGAEHAAGGHAAAGAPPTAVRLQRRLRQHRPCDAHI